MDGIFAGYFTGALGSGFGIFVIGSGQIVGADVGRVKFDGTYEIDAGTEMLVGAMKITVPANTPTINGRPMAPTESSYTFDLTLPKDLGGEKFHRIETPFGAVNVRFEFLRGLSNSVG